jgi:hypothetical protein
LVGSTKQEQRHRADLVEFVGRGTSARLGTLDRNLVTPYPLGQMQRRAQLKLEEKNDDFGIALEFSTEYSTYDCNGHGRALLNQLHQSRSRSPNYRVLAN